MRWWLSNEPSYETLATCTIEWKIQGVEARVSISKNQECAMKMKAKQNEKWKMQDQDNKDEELESLLIKLRGIR